MDPNANLNELRSLALKFLTTRDTADAEATTELEADGDRMAELFTALDEWLSNGGFLPMAWERR